RRAPARPRVRRGLERRRRPERRSGGRRAVGRGPGDRRARGVRPRASRRAARPRGRRDRGARAGPASRDRRSARLRRPVKAVLASQNRHKLEELRSALPGWELDALAADAWPEETGGTYYENAPTKPRFGPDPPPPPPRGFPTHPR